MKKQLTLSEKLKRYSLLASGALANSFTTNAQVVYTDIVPDFIGTGDVDYQIDLNNDRIFDFSLQRDSYSFTSDFGDCSSVRIQYNYFNNLAGYGECSNCVLGTAEVAKLNPGDSISENQPWFKGAGMTYNYKWVLVSGSSCTVFNLGFEQGSYLLGNWLNAVDQYVGVRLFKDDHYYYGWVRMSVDVNKYTVKDYAYNANPDKAIAAADTGCIMLEMCGNGIDDNCNGQIDENCCPSPPNTSELKVTSTTAKLAWDAVNTAEDYELRYKIIDAPKWTGRISNVAGKKLKNLSPDATYVWQVRTMCWASESIASDWTKMDHFHTLSLKESDTALRGDELQIFPNPTSGALTIILSMDQEETAEAKIEVLNMLGQIIISEKAAVDQGKLQKEIQLGDAAANGMYLVKVIINDRVYTAQINLQK